MTDAADRSTPSSTRGAAGTPGTAGTASYRERLVPGVGGWAAALGFALVRGLGRWPARPAGARGREPAGRRPQQG